MVQASVTRPTSLHQRLLLMAKGQKKHMVQMIRELVEQSLTEKEKDQVARSYEALDKLIGICKDDVTHTSATINETLYGENGAWRAGKVS